MQHPYRPEPPPPLDPAEWARILWPTFRTFITALWAIVLVYSGIVGLLRWVEFGHPWPALWQCAYWAPTFPFVYFPARYAFFKWPPTPPEQRRR
jgi:hypothetical protein